MSDKSIIAWTTHTANFWLGCTKVSEGCKHCYAETLTTNRMGLDVWGAHAPRQEIRCAATRVWAPRSEIPGDIPSAQDWLTCIKPEPWMGRTQKLEGIE